MKPILFALASLLAASISFAADPIVHKDWMTAQGPDEVFVKDSCLAATNVATGTNRAQLLLSFTKDRLNVPQLLVKVWDAPVPDAQLLIQTSSKTTYPLFLWKPSASSDQPSIYWYAPIGWSPLLDYIAAAMDLNILGNTIQLKVSLRGSAASLRDMSTCLKAEEIVPLGFLKKLNAKIEAQAPNYSSIDEMIAGIEANFANDRETVVKTKELADLRKGSKKLLDQEAVALEAFNTAQRSWQKATDALNAQQAEKQRLEQVLAQATVDLQQQEAALADAQETARRKKAIYDPIRAQYQPYLDDVAAKQAALDRNIRDERNLRSRIGDLEDAIPALRRERDQLTRRINDLQSEIDRARRDYEDADREADRYDVEREFRDALSRDFMYRNYMQDAERYRREARQHSDDANRARSQQRAAEGNLRSCRQDPNRDCSAFERQARDFERQANDAERDARSAQSRSQSAEWSARNRADSIRRDIQSRKDTLVRDADQKHRRYRDLQSQQDSARNRRNQIDSDLPSLQNELAGAQNRLANTLNARPGLQQALNDSVQRREEARVRLDYDRIEREYKESAAAVANLEKAIATSKQTIADAQKGLKRIQPVIDELTKDLALKTQRRDKAAQTLAAIQDQLKPFREQEAVLLRALNELTASFDQGKARYQRTYESWVRPAPAVPFSIGTF